LWERKACTLLVYVRVVLCCDMPHDARIAGGLFSRSYARMHVCVCVCASVCKCVYVREKEIKTDKSVGATGRHRGHYCC
jgi:hypothetical protein